MSLRRRLVAVLVAFVVLGLAVFAVITYQLYSRSEYQQVDSQLLSASPGLLRSLQGGNSDGGGHGGGPDDNLPPGSFVALRSPSGAAVAGSSRQVPCYGDRGCPPPALPATLTSAGHPERLLTVGAQGGSGSFRVLVRSDPGPRPDGSPGGPGTQPGGDGGAAPGQPDQPGGYVVTAIPLTDVSRSLHGLIVTELVVGAAVVLGVSVFGFLVIAGGLRPLRRLTTTAQAIARGNLGLRAAPADERSEVGQLALAFNTMMGNIETAFADREASEQRLRQFLADASHELRTPLTSIRGYAELYRLGATGADLDTAMSRIEQHATEMGGLVEELLLLARLDQAAPPRREPVDLGVLVAEAVEDAAVTDPARRLTLDAGAPVWVVGDPSHLRRAVGNLLTNALRHTPAGTPVEVTVTAGGGGAAVVVRDHGPGLPPEGIEHAFERFWRADRSRTGPGAGLGLAIVAAVAAEHGGHASVRNPAEGGAEFTIRLPVPAPGDTPIEEARKAPAFPVDS